MVLDIIPGLSPQVMAALQEFYAGEVHGFDTIDKEEDTEKKTTTSTSAPSPGGGSSLLETMGRLRLNDSMKRSAHEHEKQLLANAPTTLQLTKPSDAAQVLKEQGVVRLSRALSESTCDSLRKSICKSLDAAVLEGRDMVAGRTEGFGNFGTGFGFGASRMREKRWDMYLPIDGEYRATLDELLLGKDAKLGNLFREMMFEGGDSNADENKSGSELFDWSSFTSDPGAARQPVHPDNRFQPEPPILTAFVALQDVTEAMGPTIFLPGTHSAIAHDQFNNLGSDDDKDELLATSSYEKAILSKGDTVIFDPRCLHCGDANTSDASRRVLLYVSFRNPRCRDSTVQVPPGSLGVFETQLSLHDFGTPKLAQ
jgi:hypothetical protein